MYLTREYILVLQAHNSETQNGNNRLTFIKNDLEQSLVVFFQRLGRKR